MNADGSVEPTNEHGYIEAFRDPNRKIARSLCVDRRGHELIVSTVFLALDHRFGMEDISEPILFETMIFGLPGDGEAMWRCSTYEQALEQHNHALQELASHAMSPQ